MMKELLTDTERILLQGMLKIINIIETQPQPPKKEEEEKELDDIQFMLKMLKEIDKYFKIKTALEIFLFEDNKNAE